jgi:hypothetical protein
MSGNSEIPSVGVEWLTTIAPENGPFSLGALSQIKAESGRKGVIYRPSEKAIKSAIDFGFIKPAGKNEYQLTTHGLNFKKYLKQREKFNYA